MPPFAKVHLMCEFRRSIQRLFSVAYSSNNLLTEIVSPHFELPHSESYTPILMQMSPRMHLQIQRKSARNLLQGVWRVLSADVKKGNNSQYTFIEFRSQN